MSLVNKVGPFLSINARYWFQSSGRCFAASASPLPKMKGEHISTQPESLDGPVIISAEEYLQTQKPKYDPKLLEDLEHLDTLFSQCDGWPVDMYSLNKMKQGSLAKE